MHNLKELKIWHKAIDMAVGTYKATADFPREERCGLTSQIRRSVISITSNISEGAGRNFNNEFIHFPGVANGSSYELQMQLIISNRLELISNAVVEPLLLKIDEIQK